MGLDRKDRKKERVQGKRERERESVCVCVRARVSVYVHLRKPLEVAKQNNKFASSLQGNFTVFTFKKYKHKSTHKLTHIYANIQI